MNEMEILLDIIDLFQQNPLLLGLLFSIIRNLGGYLYNGFYFNTWSYSKAQFAATLALYESFFIGLQGVAGLSASWTLALTIAADLVKSLKNSLAKIAEATA